ncbi:hypothetical protein ACRTBZ_30785, partial [Burkholderia pseudomallei]
MGTSAHRHIGTSAHRRIGASAHRRIGASACSSMALIALRQASRSRSTAGAAVPPLAAPLAGRRFPAR